MCPQSGTVRVEETELPRLLRREFAVQPGWQEMHTRLHELLDGVRVADLVADPTPRPA